MIDFVLRRKLLVVFIWLLLAGAGLILYPRLGHRMDYSYTTPGQPGYEANLHIEQRFGLDAAFEPTVAMLKLREGESMATPTGQALAAHTFAAAEGAGVVSVVDYANTSNKKFILDGGKTTWALISLPNPDYGVGKGMAHRLAAHLNAAVPAGATLTLTGFEQLLSNSDVKDPNVLLELLLGAFGALLILLLIYKSAIALVPVILALPTLLVTFLAVYGMTYVAPVSYFVPFIVLLLGLGIAIDYSLIVVARWREEREVHTDNLTAVRSAMQSAGHAVLLSGVTVSVGLLSLVVLPVPFLRSVGLGGVLIPVVATLSSLTLLPVALATVGPFLEKVRFSRGSTTFSKGWQSWGSFILRHRLVSMLAGLAVIVSLAIPALHLNTAEPDIASLAGVGTARQEFNHLQASGVPAAIDFPIQILTHGGTEAAQSARTIALDTPGVYDVFSPAIPSLRQGKDAVLIVVPRDEGSSPQGKQTVTLLRERLANLPGGAEVGGSTASDMAFTAAVYGSFPRMLALVSLLTLLIMTVALRSPVLALKAVVLNIISLGAVFGFMVLFWQQGLGLHLIYGFPPTGGIRAWIPTIIFACLFGLSMDYEVFVLVRIREEYDRLASTDAAVVAGLARTGRLVTCAALILMMSFLSISGGPNQITKIIATTLAFGVLLDAVIVRTILVPVLVSLMGDANWWVPRFVKQSLRFGHQR